MLLEKEVAISSAYHAAPGYWKVEAFDAVEQLCQKQRFFTADDVWDLVDRGIPERRALGGVMRKAQFAGLCRSTDRVRKSVSSVNHHRPLTVWESLVFDA